MTELFADLAGAWSGRLIRYVRGRRRTRYARQGSNRNSPFPSLPFSARDRAMVNDMRRGDVSEATAYDEPFSWIYFLGRTDLSSITSRPK